MADWDELRRKEKERQFRKRHKIPDPEAEDRKKAAALALERQEQFSGKSSTRALSTGYDLVGAAGEVAFAKWAGKDLDDIRTGKRNINIILNMRGINVLTARKPTYLLVEKRKNRADIHVLAEYRDDRDEARLLGWATKADVAAASAWDAGGKGIVSHVIPRQELKPMHELKVLLGLAPVQEKLL